MGEGKRTQKKRNKYFHKDKLVRKIITEGAKIWDAMRNQDWVELDKPVHRGYYANWVLRDDIVRRGDADVFRQVLKISNMEVWSSRKDFKYKDYKTKKWMVLNPGLKKLKPSEYEALHPSVQKYFTEHTATNYLKFWKDKTYFQCNLTYQFVVKIKKCMMTHRREHNNILYQMDAENDYMLYKETDGHPWGQYSEGRYWKQQEDRKEKLKAERDLGEVKKNYNNNNE